MIMKVSRREFLKISAITGTIVLMSRFDGDILQVYASKAETKPPYLSEVNYIGSMCGMCPASCSIMVRVRDGVVERIMGNPYGYDMNRDTICARGNSGVFRLYNPDRLKKPLRRKNIGVREGWDFEAVDWDQVLTELANHFKEKIENGEILKTILVAGWFVCEFYRPVALAFMKTIGSPNAVVNTMPGCFLPKLIGWKSVIGVGSHAELMMDYDNTRYVIVTRRNVAGSVAVVFTSRFSENLGKFKLVVLDPRYSETAAKADEWVPIKPGTDLAFILGMMNVILNEKLYDEEYLKKYTNAPMLINIEEKKPFKVVKDEELGKMDYLVWDKARNKAVMHREAVDPALEGEYEVDGVKVVPVLEGLKRHVMQYTPEWAEKITDVPADTIRRIAIEFATTKPSGFDPGWHGSRHYNEPMFWRSLAILNALVGSIGREGGILLTGEGIESTLHPSSVAAPPESVVYQWMESKGIFFNLGRTYQACNDIITGKVEYKINGKPVPGKWTIIDMGANIARTMPEGKLVEETCKNENIDLIIAIDALPTDSNIHADYILPEGTYLERNEPILSIPYAPVIGFMARNKAIDPLYDTKPLVDILYGILDKIGLGDKFLENLASMLKADPEKVKTYYKQYGVEGIQRAQAESYGISYKEIKEKGFVVVEDEKEVRDKNLELLREWKLNTPTGRIEIWGFMCQMAYEKSGKEECFPLASWVEPLILKEELSENEFYVVYGKIPTMTHTSTGDNPVLTHILTHDKYRRVWINRARAERLGIRDGDLIIIKSKMTGEEVKARAYVTEEVREDTVFITHTLGQEADVLKFKLKDTVPYNLLNKTLIEPVVGGAILEEVIVEIRKA